MSSPAVLTFLPPPAPLLMAPSDTSDGDPPRQVRFDKDAPDQDELPFKVELWDPSASRVELVLAVTANGTIGYAAYYAAVREYPERFITLRHNNSIVSRWNGPKN